MVSDILLGDRGTYVLISWTHVKTHRYDKKCMGLDIHRVNKCPILHGVHSHYL